MIDEKLKEAINKLPESERKILKIATTSIYLADNHDYMKALWEIIHVITEDEFGNVFCDSELFDFLYGKEKTPEKAKPESTKITTMRLMVDDNMLCGLFVDEIDEITGEIQVKEKETHNRGISDPTMESAEKLGKYIYQTFEEVLNRHKGCLITIDMADPIRHYMRLWINALNTDVFRAFLRPKQYQKYDIQDMGE